MTTFFCNGQHITMSLFINRLHCLNKYIMSMSCYVLLCRAVTYDIDTTLTTCGYCSFMFWKSRSGVLLENSFVAAVDVCSRPCQAFQPSVAAGDDCGSSMPGFSAQRRGRPVTFVEASAVCFAVVAVPTLPGGRCWTQSHP